MRSRLAFAALAFGISGVLFVAVWRAGTQRVLPGIGLLVPALAIIAAAQGFGWRRKVAFVIGTLGVFLVVDGLAIVSGLTRTASGLAAEAAPLPAALGHLYETFLIAYPLAALVWFVGRRPSLLWDRRPSEDRRHRESGWK